MRQTLFVLALFSCLTACSSDRSSDSLPEQTTLSPGSTAVTTSEPTSAASTTTSDPESDAVEIVADSLFVNTRVTTMDPAQPSAEAVAVIGQEIAYVGSLETATTMVGPDTRIYDLGGRALLPGFVDPHNHIFLSADTPELIEEAQRYLLGSGVTTLGDTAVGPLQVERLREADERGDLRIRASLYPVYNSKCDGVYEDDWFVRFAPERDPAAMVRVPGIKIFADSAGNIGDPCGWAAMSVELPTDFIERVGGGPFGESVLTPEEMAEVIAKNQERGYQVVIHARGDVTAENSLTAFEIALAGEPNTYRHRLEHNDFIRPDQLSRYGEIGVIPTVRGRPSACILNDNGGLHRFGEAVQPWFFRIRSLIDANPGLPIAWHSDIVFERSRRPAVHDLLDLVTRRAVRPTDGTVCEPPDWFAAEAVSVEEALRLMTINGAYALFMDDMVGSIEAGKFADLIVLSDDPLEVDPVTLGDLEVQMTVVGGTVEHCTLEELCEGGTAGELEPTGDDAPTVTAGDITGCDDQTCYELSVACRGLPARQVTVRVRHRAPADGTIIYVGGSNITNPYGDVFAMHPEGYDTYSIVYAGELGYYSGVVGAGFADISCSTTEVIRWIVENLAERPDAVAAHGISAGANQLGYGLALHGLGDLVQVVVFASGPIHTDLEEACLTYSTPARGASIDRAYGWEGNGDYCATAGAPDPARELLRSESIVTSDPSQSRSYDYPGTSVVFILGADDEGPLDVSERFFDEITTEKSWTVLDGVGHLVPLDPSGVEAIRMALVDELSEAP